MIVLSHVRRAYDGVPALDDVSLTAPAGKVLALLGSSGSGKSTLLRLVAGLEDLSSGEISLGEERLSGPGHNVPAEARRIGMVFQDFSLFPHLSVGANVAFGLHGHTRGERDEAALRWLDRVGLMHRAHAFPHELSGGEQQRVALARALAPAPRALLLDEPFSGLDPVLRAELREATMNTLAETHTTALFVTHDAEEALMIADRLAILKQGRVLQESAPREAYEHPTCADAAAALGPVNLYDTHIENGAAMTPFGAVSAPHLGQGARARVVVRAEALALRPGTLARLRDLRPHGAHDLARIEAGGIVWNALIPSRLGLGERVDVELQSWGAFAFHHPSPDSP